MVLSSSIQELGGSSGAMGPLVYPYFLNREGAKELLGISQPRDSLVFCRVCFSTTWKIDWVERYSCNSSMQALYSSTTSNRQKKSVEYWTTQFVSSFRGDLILKEWLSVQHAGGYWKDDGIWFGAAGDKTIQNQEITALLSMLVGRFLSRTWFETMWVGHLKESTGTADHSNSSYDCGATIVLKYVRAVCSLIHHWIPTSAIRMSPSDLQWQQSTPPCSTAEVFITRRRAFLGGTPKRPNWMAWSTSYSAR